MTAGASTLRARRSQRAGAAVCGALALLLGAGAFLHTPAGRPWLSRLAGQGCPFGHEKLDPARREALRRLGLAKLAGTERSAPAHAALGFELGRTVRADVEAWITRHGLSCRSEAQGASLACDAVSGKVVERADAGTGSLTFHFDPRRRLVGVLYMVRTPDVERAVSLAAAEQGALRARFGEPMRAFGELSVASLSNGALRQARAEYRYRDFSTFASVTSLGKSSYLVTEEAQLSD